MKRFAIASTALFLAMAGCSSGGGVVPPPVPSPSPTPAPACTSAAIVPQSGAPHYLRPRGWSAPVAGNLVYHGGPVLVRPQVYLVLWGLAQSDPVAQREVALFQNVGGSDWLSTVAQYCEKPNVYVENPTGMLAGVWSDTDPVPASPTQAQIAAEAKAAVAHFAGVDDANASVVVALPDGVKPSGFISQYCAWHANVGSLSYTNLPYMPMAGAACGATSSDKLAGVTIVGGHELAESITDPQPSSGWTGPGGEIGDKCAWVDIQSIDLNGVSEPMQPLWSNVAGKCVQ